MIEYLLAALTPQDRRRLSSLLRSISDDPDPIVRVRPLDSIVLVTYLGRDRKFEVPAIFQPQWYAQAVTTQLQGVLKRRGVRTDTIRYG